MNIKDAIALIEQEMGVFPPDWKNLPWHDFDFSRYFLSNEELQEDITREEAEFLSQVVRGPLVLDAGCGGGRSLVSLQAVRDDWSLFGVDIGMYPLKVARTRLPESSFFRGDITALPFSEGSFCTVLSLFGSWLSMSREHFVSFLGESYRVLADDGLLILEAPSSQSLRELHGLCEWSLRNNEEYGRQLVLSENLVDEQETVYVRKDWIVSLDSDDLRRYCQFYPLYSASDITQKLQDCGFSMIATYGDYDGSIPDDESLRIIVTAQK